MKERAKQFLTFGDNLITKPLRRGRVPILDPLYRSGKDYIDINYRGKTKEKIRKGIANDDAKINKFVSRLLTKRNVGGKRSNKTRKNVSRKNRK